MFSIQKATLQDKDFWVSLDTHLSSSTFKEKVQNSTCFIIYSENEPVGFLRYNLFWDIILFLNFIYSKDSFQNKGFGKKAMLWWETETKKQGYTFVITSTQADETAQHFYRKLGYQDKGALFFDGTPISQAAEIILIKNLK